MIDFLFGNALGYVYLKQRNKDGVLQVDSNNEQINKRTGILHQKDRVDLALIIIFVMILVALVVFSLTNPEGDILSHSELWWRYSCLFTLLNGVMIYLLAMDNGLLHRVFSTKGVVFVGGISSTAFLIHQMVIRYLNVFIKYIETDNLLIKNGLIVGVPFLLTIVACVIWNKFFQKIKLIIQTKRSNLN